MAFTTSSSPSEDIIVQEGTFAFDYDCSGSVFKGQGVYAIGTMQVKAPADSINVCTPGCVGVAAYDQTDGKPVAVYGPGNICRVIVSGTSTAVGEVLVLAGNGYFKEAPASYTISGVNAIALETQGTDAGTCKVMLF